MQDCDVYANCHSAWHEPWQLAQHGINDDVIDHTFEDCLRYSARLYMLVGQNNRTESDGRDC